MSDPIADLRDEIRALDAELVDLAAKRLALARRVGEAKLARGLPIRNYAVEAEALHLARERAHEDGISERLAEELVKMLIAESLRVQERDRRSATRERTAPRGENALVIGGAGNMGRWFVEFLESKGYHVTLLDPRAPDGPRPRATDLRTAARKARIVVIATPPSSVGRILRDLEGATDALIFEIGSLKAPFLDDLRHLAKSGARVTSLHPMWGPTTDLLADKNIVLCDCGHADATREARALFEDTAAHIVELPLDDHDAHMARTLGIPHALNLIFAHTLQNEGIPYTRLDELGGPTFRKQAAIAREVAHENTELYHEIQTHNPHTAHALTALRDNLDAFEAAIATRETFRTYMHEARHWFHSTPDPHQVNE